MGHDGLARALAPVHTVVDGDPVFGLATCARPAPDLAALMALHAAAADVVGRAVVHAVLAAETATTPPAPSGRTARSRRRPAQRAQRRSRPGRCCGSMTAVEPADLAAFLAEHPPFDSLESGGARRRSPRRRGSSGSTTAPSIHDAFQKPTDEVFVVVAGAGGTSCGTTPARRGRSPTSILGPAACSASGDADRAVDRSARGRGRRGHGRPHSRVARRAGLRDPHRGAVPGRDLVPSHGRGAATDVPTYSSVDELIEREPLLVDPDDPGRRRREADDRARARRPWSCRRRRAVRAGHGRGCCGHVSWSTAGRRPRRPREVMDTAAPVGGAWATPPPRR